MGFGIGSRKSETIESKADVAEQEQQPQPAKRTELERARDEIAELEKSQHILGQEGSAIHSELLRVDAKLANPADDASIDDLVLLKQLQAALEIKLGAIRKKAAGVDQRLQSAREYLRARIDEARSITRAIEAYRHDLGPDGNLAQRERDLQSQLIAISHQRRIIDGKLADREARLAQIGE